jgi:hypothetical protein
MQILLNAKAAVDVIINYIRELSLPRLYSVNNGMINGCREVGGMRFGRGNPGPQCRFVH